MIDISHIGCSKLWRNTCHGIFTQYSMCWLSKMLNINIFISNSLNQLLYGPIKTPCVRYVLLSKENTFILLLIHSNPIWFCISRYFYVLFATFYHFFKGFSSSLLTFPLSGITCKIMSVNITYNLNLKVNLLYFTQNENEFDNNRSCIGIYLTYLSPT